MTERQTEIARAIALGESVQAVARAARRAAAVGAPAADQRVRRDGHVVAGAAGRLGVAHGLVTVPELKQVYCDTDAGGAWRSGYPGQSGNPKGRPRAGALGGRAGARDRGGAGRVHRRTATRRIVCTRLERMLRVLWTMALRRRSAGGPLPARVHGGPAGPDGGGVDRVRGQAGAERRHDGASCWRVRWQGSRSGAENRRQASRRRGRAGCGEFEAEWLTCAAISATGATGTCRSTTPRRGTGCGSGSGRRSAQVADVLQSQRLVVMLKARQLGMSWLTTAYGLWLMLFRPAATVLLVLEAGHGGRAPALLPPARHVWEAANIHARAGRRRRECP